MFFLALYFLLERPAPTDVRNAWTLKGGQVCLARCLLGFGGGGILYPFQCSQAHSFIVPDGAVSSLHYYSMNIAFITTDANEATRLINEVYAGNSAHRRSAGTLGLRVKPSAPGRGAKPLRAGVPKVDSRRKREDVPPAFVKF